MFVAGRRGRAVVANDNAFSPAKVMDFTMLLFSGGKERTEDEFRARP